MLEEQTFLIRELKIRLVTKSHSFPKKGKHEIPLKGEKVFIWYQVIIEIAQEVETSSPRSGKKVFTW